MERTNHFEKSERLKHKRHFEALFKKATRSFHFPLLALWQDADLAHPVEINVGFSAPKKHYKKAVDRNRIKRLLREIYRQHAHELKETLSKNEKQIILLFVVMKTDNTSYDALRDKMVLLLRDIAAKIEHGQ